MLNAKNGRLSLPGGTMDYIRFGRGGKTLVMIPGVGDGLKTVKGMALPFALLYRSLAKDFTVYVFSRRAPLAPDATTRRMADDLNAAMEKLGLSAAAVVGVSQGGMIAQWLAVDHPDRVGKLALVVTLARPNPTVEAVIGRWLEMARRGDYRGIMLDTAERSYSEKRVRQARWTYRLMGRALRHPGEILRRPRRQRRAGPRRLPHAGDRRHGRPNRHRGGLRGNRPADSRQFALHV